MPFSVSTFRTAGIAQGGARPNLFDVQFTNAGGGSTVGTPLMTYLCKIASIPPSTMGVVEVPYFGRMVKVPGNRTFDNLSLTVINDEGFELRNDIEKWMNKMNSHVSNTSEQPQGLLAEVVVQHYTRDQKPAGGAGGSKWTFIGAFPVALGEIALDWSSNDTIEEFTIDLAYDYWTHGTTS